MWSFYLIMSEESVFLCYVRHIFKTWIGFQAAIDDGMGGRYAREKEEWMTHEVENYFKMHEIVTPDDIEDYVGQMLDNEFDTEFEDGSLREVSVKFCSAYNLSLSNPNHEIFSEMKKASISYSRPRTVSNSEESAEEVMSVNSVTKEIRKLTTNEEEDGWITVSSKHNRHA